MKATRRLLLFSLTLLLTFTVPDIPANGSNTASAQGCNNCQIFDPSSRCYACVALASKGWLICQTVACRKCKFRGECNRPPHRPGFEDFSIDSLTIGRIAITHPRFAATLALLNKEWSGGTSVYGVKWAATPITAEEVNYYIDPTLPGGQAYWKEEEKPIPEGTEEVEHVVRLEENLDGTLTLDLEIKEGSAPSIDPPYLKMRAMFQRYGPNSWGSSTFTFE